MRIDVKNNDYKENSFIEHHRRLQMKKKASRSVRLELPPPASLSLATRGAIRAASHLPPQAAPGGRRRRRRLSGRRRRPAVEPKPSQLASPPLLLPLSSTRLPPPGPQSRRRGLDVASPPAAEAGSGRSLAGSAPPGPDLAVAGVCPPPSSCRRPCLGVAAACGASGGLAVAGAALGRCPSGGWGPPPPPPGPDPGSP